MEAAVRLLADAIERGLRLCIVADYDCDGATACAVGWRGLRMLGATEVSYLVPDRVVDGYGLTPPIARRVKDRKSTRLNSSHLVISYAVFCLKKKKKHPHLD